MIGEIQPIGHDSCAGYVAAMITGEPIQSVIDFIGHNGQEGFSNGEIYRYLFDRGYLMRADCSFISYELDEAATPPAPSPPQYHYPDQMLLIMSALYMDKYKHLQTVFDDLVSGFLKEHQIDPQAITSHLVAAERSKGLTGVSGYKLLKESRKLRYVRGNIPLSCPAYVVSQGKQFHHALYWDGQRLFDPHFKSEVSIYDYIIMQWLPVQQYRVPYPPTPKIGFFNCKANLTPAQTT